MHRLFKTIVLVLLLALVSISGTFEQEASDSAGVADPPTTNSQEAGSSRTQGGAPQSEAPFASSEPVPSPWPSGAPFAPGREASGAAARSSSGAFSRDYPVDPNTTEVSISFVKADIANVLGFLSLASGVPIVTDAEVTGTVTIHSMRRVTLAVAYEVVNSALRARGYTMMGTLRDRLIRVVSLQKAVADKTSVRVGADLQRIGTSDSLITQVVPVQYVSAAQLKEELQPLVATEGASLVAVSSSNVLIITDTEGNVRRLVQIINLSDQDTSDILAVEVYQCKYAAASVLLSSLEKIFGVEEATAEPTSPREFFRRMGQQDEDSEAGAGADGLDLLSLMGQLRLSADERTNSLIIFASRPKINMVLDLVKKLDITMTSDVRPRIFRLQHADASMVAEQLNTLFEQPEQTVTPDPRSGRGGRRRGADSAPQTTEPSYAGLKRNLIVADVRTNSVVVTATEENMMQFEIMIQELDAENVLSDITRVFPLLYANAEDLEETLTALFSGSAGARFDPRDVRGGTARSLTEGDPIASLRNITVVGEPKTNTLLVTGPPQVFAMVENIINQLDQRPVQVFIEVAIVDVILDHSTKFGVEWTWHSDALAPDGTTAESTVGTDFGLDDISSGLRYSVISSNLQTLLRALTTRSNVRVLSTPTITTADNVPARISIGREEPYVSTEQETTGGRFVRTVDFKDISIALDVTPHVSEATGLITLEVHQTINELIGREPELNAPIIASREAITTVMVNDGQTIVIGGIIKENRVKETSAVPILSEIPLLGELFKSRSWRTQQSELMVFLTPHILRDEQSVTDITARQRLKLSDADGGAQLSTD